MGAGVGVDIAAGHGALPPSSSAALPPPGAAAAATALEARQQLREMAAVEMELRQLRQMQAVQQRAFERDQVQRQQLRAAAVGAGAGVGGSHHPHQPHPHLNHNHAAAAHHHHHHHLAGLGGVGGTFAATLGGGLMRGHTGGRCAGAAAAAVAGLASAAAAAAAGGGLLDRPSSAGPLGAAADLLGRVGGSPPLRGVAAGAGPGPGAGAAGAGTPGAATAALAGAKLKRPHSAGPLGFMADLMDETDDGVGTSRADAGAATAGAGAATAGTGAIGGDARDAPGIPRRHSAGALRTFTDLLNDAGSDDDDGDDNTSQPTSAGASTKTSGVNAEGGGDAIVSPRIAAAQARVEALEKQLELVRQQQQARAKAVGAGVPGAGAGAGSPPTAAAAPSGSAASTDPAVAPHIAAAQARADALEKKLEQQKELQRGIQGELLQLRDAEVSDARIAAAQARVDALEKQLADGAAAKAGAAGAAEAQAVPAATAADPAPPVAKAVAPATPEARAAASVATVPAAALAALPFQRLDSNPRRPARNSGFPLPLMTTKDDKYVPPKIKSLDGFRAAFDKMRTNMKSKSNKRKASEMSNAGIADSAGESDNSTAINDKIPLPEATFNGDIFSNMIYRGEIDLMGQDWTVTGMYSINEKSKAAEKIRQYQAEQILLQKVDAAKAEAAAARAKAASEAAAAAASAPDAPETQPAKRKKGWTAEQEQMIAELKRQKAELDEKLARHQAAKSKEKAAAKPVLGGGSLLPPILPNAAIDPNTGIPKAPADPSTENCLAQDASKESEKSTKEPELPSASVKPSDIRPLVSNEAMGAASTLLDLIPRAAKNDVVAGVEKVQIQQQEPEKNSQMMLENGTKRSADELAGESTDQGPLSPNSEDKMMTDLQTMGKRKKARRLTPPGGETSAPNALVGAGKELEKEVKTVAVDAIAASNAGGSAAEGAATGGAASNGSN